jgi:hypothetical protein
MSFAGLSGKTNIPLNKDNLLVFVTDRTQRCPCLIKHHAKNDTKDSLPWTSAPYEGQQPNTRPDPSTLCKVFGRHWSGGWVGPTAKLENLETTRQIILDFKLSPYFTCNKFSFGCFPGVWLLTADVSKPSISSIFLGSKMQYLTA